MRFGNKYTGAFGSFDPNTFNVNLNENSSTKLLKKIISIILKNEVNKIEIKELAKILGTSASSLNRWVKKLEKTIVHRVKFIINLETFRKLKRALSKYIAITNKLIGDALNNAIIEFIESQTIYQQFVFKFFSILDKYIPLFIPSQNLLKILDRNEDYFNEYMRTTTSNPYMLSKLIDLLVRIHLTEDHQLKLKDDKFNELKEELNNFFYKFLSDTGYILGDVKTQFDIIISSLVAFSKSERNLGKSNYVMSLSELSTKVSWNKYDKILSIQFQHRRVLRAQAQCKRIINHLIKAFFNAPEESYEAIVKLRSYLRQINPRQRRWQKYNIFFKELKFLHFKELFDLFLGLDLWDLNFIPDAEIVKYSKDLIILKVHRHHLDVDPEYFLIFSDVTEYITFKLLPLTRDSHFNIHNKINSEKTELIRARAMHLFNLIRYAFSVGVDYYELFLKEFKTKTAIINKQSIKIWEGIDNEIIKRWIDRWIDFKTLSEEIYYNKYYPVAYSGYLSYFNDFLHFINNDSRCAHPEFWYWYCKVYLKRNLYPWW